jgi:hypothetical protein
VDPYRAGDLDPYPFADGDASGQGEWCNTYQYPYADAGCLV